MLRFTLIHRVSDGNPLCETIDEGDRTVQKTLAQCKTDAKAVMAKLGGSNSGGVGSYSGGATSKTSDQHGSVDTRKGFCFHYLRRDDVVYLTCADKGFKSELALHFLHTAADDFAGRYPATAVADAMRPFACIDFEPTLAKAQTRYNRDAADGNPQNQQRISEMEAINSELSEVSHLMSQNIEDVLLRGEGLDSVFEKSQRLRHSSSKFAKQTKYLNWLAKWRTYGPFAAVAVLVFFFIYIRMYWF
ncbi:vesicle transporter [Thecamonas trahens ATCC 50062]|uniref:Vesicle transporter n=1 Tax=Thecamonas trahens ATCC 50062 TaxID=461836 RepID=A0A0L0DWQ8_THETB|nr:vesicle transporter [Thecamonas trahens ATCC 50062]KNC55973.1 vesicle transporter [Thecamonas trahens ATCC 50062]|eukprot:XP_013761020.1 vesicle transporter [Thecamonas trahens ATCC 50062]